MATTTSTRSTRTCGSATTSRASARSRVSCSARTSHSDRPRGAQAWLTCELQRRAAGIRLLGSRLLVGPELFGARPLDAGTAIGTPLELQLGAHVAASPRVQLGLAAGVGVINAIGEPRWRALAALVWTP